MLRGTIFWMLMILWGLSIVAGFIGFVSPVIVGVSQVLQWVLFCLLGVQVYGSMIK